MVEYRVVCYIKVEQEKPTQFKSYKEAAEEQKHLERIQPENIYSIEKVKGD